ncbi:hypothetical protein Tco_1014398, partial [Tanacetum coccineum]
VYGIAKVEISHVKWGRGGESDGGEVGLRFVMELQGFRRKT